jgi:hypothetical protein
MTNSYDIAICNVYKIEQHVELDLPNLSLRRNNQLICTIMYQVNNNMVPDYLIDLFRKTSTLRNHETRQAEFNLAQWHSQGQIPTFVKNHSRTEEL